MDDLLSNAAAVAGVDLILGTLGGLLAWFGPWPRDSWWPARAVWAVASVSVALGLVRFAMLL